MIQGKPVQVHGPTYRLLKRLSVKQGKTMAQILDEAVRLYDGQVLPDK